MTTEPPAGGGRQAQPGHPPSGDPAPGYPAPGYPAPGHPAPGYPASGHPTPAPGARFDGPLPEPPTGFQPALQWGDPTPAPAPAPRKGPPPRYSKLAVAALVAGILLGAAGLALILGIAALISVRRSKLRGTGLAVAGMVLTLLWAAAAYTVNEAVLSKPPVRDASGVIVRKGDVRVDQLRAGDCLEKWATSDKVGKVTGVPCTTAHDAEVFHTFDLGGAAFPGDPEVTKLATTGCVDASKTKIKDADLKNVKVALLKPLESSWKENDHRVTCVAVQNSGTITRSVRK